MELILSGVVLVEQVFSHLITIEGDELFGVVFLAFLLSPFLLILFLILWKILKIESGKAAIISGITTVILAVLITGYVFIESANYRYKFVPEGLIVEEELAAHSMGCGAVYYQISQDMVRKIQEEGVGFLNDSASWFQLPVELTERELETKHLRATGGFTCGARENKPEVGNPLKDSGGYFKINYKREELSVILPDKSIFYHVYFTD